MGKNKKTRKKLQELTFKDSFMFAAVMMDEENAKGFLERALDVMIDHVDISYEKSIIYNPEYKGVRLDVFMKDDNNNHFNVEMQVANQNISKRSRYYHSQMDMELLESGADYEELSDTYVIFICDFDPIGLGKYRYTIRHTLEEDDSYDYDDGRHTIFLSTVGTNDEEVSEILVRFLEYAGADNRHCNDDYSDEYVSRLQQSVEKIKYDREWGKRYMLLDEMLKDEYNAGKEDGRIEGKAEGIADSIIDILNDIGSVSGNLESRIRLIDNVDVLANLVKKAASVQSAKEFEAELDKLS